MLAACLLTSESGGNARPFGEPAVQGPSSKCQRNPQGLASNPELLTGLVRLVLYFSLSIECGVGCEISRRGVASIIVYLL